MTDPTGSLIRFTGVLREDLTFVHVPAWETDYVFERPDEGDGTYVVDLLDGGERLLTRASPVVGWRAPTPPDEGGLRLANVLIYLPTHPDARLLVFRRLEPSLAEIFRAEVSEQVPVIGDVTLTGARRRGAVRVKWTAKHDRHVTSSVFLIRDGAPALLLAAGFQKYSFEIDPASLPGPAGRVAILVTDGFRSSTAIGPAVDGLSTDVRLEITAPEPSDVLVPDQPVTLAARASDVAGGSVPVNNVAWAVDGKPVAEGAVAATPPLEPGVHEIVATASTIGNPLGPATISITVANRNEDQEAYAKLLATLPPLSERLRDAEDS
jgi:hypothetical protein